MDGVRADRVSPRYATLPAARRQAANGSAAISCALALVTFFLTVPLTLR